MIFVPIRWIGVATPRDPKWSRTDYANSANGPGVKYDHRFSLFFNQRLSLALSFYTSPLRYFTFLFFFLSWPPTRVRAPPCFPHFSVHSHHCCVSVADSFRHSSLSRFFWDSRISCVLWCFLRPHWLVSRFLRFHRINLRTPNARHWAAQMPSSTIIIYTSIYIRSFYAVVFTCLSRRTNIPNGSLMKL